MEIEKFKKLDANLHDKTENVIRKRNLNQALSHGFVLKKFRRVIIFNQSTRLKPYINLNTDLSWWIMQFLENIMENVRKHNRKKKELFTIWTKLSYYRVFQRTSTGNRNEKAEIFTNKPVCLEISILELSKVLICEFWYSYLKPKYGEKAKLCYVNTDSFTVHIKADGIYKDIAEDIETKFDTSNYELNRPLPKEKKKKVIGIMKDELGRKIKTKFVGLRAKTYIYLIDDDSEDKKRKAYKKVCHKKKT